MVRLKRKRFIILDYSLAPSARDIAAAALSPQLMCPNGAGKQQCVNPECTKVGVPSMLYDSDPEQPSSLYLRSGLCFSCQRILNEKRRTQRKRKSDVANHSNGGGPNGSGGAGGAGRHLHHHHHHHLDGTMTTTTTTDANGNPLNNGGGYNLTLDQQHQPSTHHQLPHHPPPPKRFRLHGEILDLNPDAIIINGPLEGTRHHEPGYEYPEISVDLRAITDDAAEKTAKLSVGVLGLSPSTIITAEELLDVGGGSGVGMSEADAHAVISARDELLSNYESIFLGMSKGIFLLSQWKASWDATVAATAADKVAAVAIEQQHRAQMRKQHQQQQEEEEEQQRQQQQEHGQATQQQVGVSVMEPMAIADALASAAAVAAAQSQQQHPVGGGTIAPPISGSNDDDGVNGRNDSGERGVVDGNDNGGGGMVMSATVLPSHSTHGVSIGRAGPQDNIGNNDEVVVNQGCGTIHATMTTSNMIPLLMAANGASDQKIEGLDNVVTTATGGSDGDAVVGRDMVVEAMSSVDVDSGTPVQELDAGVNSASIVEGNEEEIFSV